MIFLSDWIHMIYICACLCMAYDKYTLENIRRMRQVSTSIQNTIRGRLFECGIGLPEITISSWQTGPALRLQTFMKRVLEGKSIEVVVLGGSISCNSGVMSEDHGYVSQFEKLLREFVPTMALISENSSHIALKNACIPATGSAFFKHCHGLSTSVNLIILETSINDHFHANCNDLHGHDCDDGVNGDIEDLVRNALGVNRNTAVLPLNFFCPLHDGGRLNGGDVYQILSSYYDLPTVSVKNAFLTKARVKEDLKEYGYAQYFSNDDVHPNEKGHHVAALLIFHKLLETYQELLQSAESDLQSGCFTMLKMTGAREERCYNENSFTKYEMRRRRHTPEQVMHDIGIIKRYDRGAQSTISQCFLAQAISTESIPALVPLHTDKWTFRTSQNRYNHTKVYYGSEGENSSISFSIEAKKPCHVFLYFLRSHYTSGIATCYVHDTQDMNKIVLPKTQFDSYMSSAGGVGHLKALDGGELPSKERLILRCDMSDHGNKDFRILGLVLGQP